MRTIPANDRLIVALDVDTRKQAADLVAKLGDSVSFYKVGLQLFSAGFGPDVVSDLIRQRKNVFIDLKIDDTPRTVETAVRNMATDGVEFFTLQGNGDTAKAAKAGRGKKQSPKFLQVTLLSSWDTEDLREHLHLEPSQEIDLDKIVVTRARRIIDSGCDGVIASGTSVRKLRETFPDILIVSPGIRPEGTKADDHKRVLTPQEAIKAGANYLVVGRPIRNSSDPAGTARRIQREIEQALKEKSAGSNSVEFRGVRLTPITTQ